MATKEGQEPKTDVIPANAADAPAKPSEPANTGKPKKIAAPSSATPISKEHREAWAKLDAGPRDKK